MVTDVESYQLVNPFLCVDADCTCHHNVGHFSEVLISSAGVDI